MAETGEQVSYSDMDELPADFSPVEAEVHQKRFSDGSELVGDRQKRFSGGSVELGDRQKRFSGGSVELGDRQKRISGGGEVGIQKRFSGSSLSRVSLVLPPALVEQTSTRCQIIRTVVKKPPTTTAPEEQQLKKVFRVFFQPT